MKEVIKDLNSIKDRYLELSIKCRTEDPRLSFELWTIAESIRKAIEELENRKEVPAEIDGGYPNWRYVCGECHGNIGTLDKYCRHCGHPIDWSGE